MKTNVQTGDIARVVGRKPEFTGHESVIGAICTVGERISFSEAFDIICTDGTKLGVTLADVPDIHWWCLFPRPIYIGVVRGVNRYALLTPIADLFLRKIADGNFTFNKQEIDELFHPGPVTSEERVRVKEELHKKGSVK